MLIDLVVVAVYFVVIVSIGLRSGRGEKSLEGYALGDRRVPWWAILASILAAEISAATFLGAPGEGFALKNFTYAQLAIGTVLGRIFASTLFLKSYYEYKVVSIYEYLEKRFGPRTRNAASATFLITRALASGTRLYVAAILLVIGYEIFAGEPASKTTQFGLYVVALLIVVGLTTLYTTAGGIKAVIWTDVIQASILLISLGTAIWILLGRIPGGFHGALAHLQGPGDLSFFATGLEAGKGVWGNVKGVLSSEYTIFAAFIGSTFVTMATHGTDQDMVQRMLTGRNHKAGSIALIGSGFADLPIVMAFLFVGILLWVFHQTHPEVALPAQNPHVFPWFIMHEMPPVVRGLLVAGVMATAMGSLSTALNALATSFCRDWYQEHFRPSADDREMLRAARIATAVFAIVLVSIGAATAWVVIHVQGSRILPIVLGIFGYTYGSLLGVFLAGALTKRRGNDAGNIFAMVCGFVVVAILSGLPNEVIAAAGGTPLTMPGWLPEISFPWRVFFGSVTTLSIALLFRTPEVRVAEALER